MRTTTSKPYSLDELKDIVGIKKQPEILRDGTEIISHVFNHLMTESSCSFYTITDYSRMKYLFISPGIEMVTGYPLRMFECGGIELMLSLLHPEEGDLLRLIHQKMVTFFNSLSPEDRLNYRYCYDVRIRKADGEYVRLHCQFDLKELDEYHQPYIGKETFTDITLYDTSPYMTLSIHCLSGSSGTNLMVYRFNFSHADGILSKKEKEVQALVDQGSSSKEIAKRLCLSKHTVDTYRRRIKRKRESFTCVPLH